MKVLGFFFFLGNELFRHKHIYTQRQKSQVQRLVHLKTSSKQVKQLVKQQPCTSASEEPAQAFSPKHAFVQLTWSDLVVTACSVGTAGLIGQRENDVPGEGNHMDSVQSI